MELNKTVRATCHQRRRTSLGRSFLREQSSPQICLWRSRSPCRTRVVIHHHPGALEKGKHTAKLNIFSALPPPCLHSDPASSFPEQPEGPLPASSGESTYQASVPASAISTDLLCTRCEQVGATARFQTRKHK